MRDLTPALILLVAVVVAARVLLGCDDITAGPCRDQVLSQGSCPRADQRMVQLGEYLVCQCREGR